MNQQNEFPIMNRRAFLSSAATAGTLAVLTPSTVFSTQANTVLSIGLIGCGGRGSWIAELFAKERSKYRVTACSDYFQERVDSVGSKFGIDPSRRFAGLSGYKRLLATDVDAVVIETPPYFHPQQAMDSIRAGKHVYLAKPIAVDAPGCQLVAEAGRQATSSKRVFLVDFQARANPHFRSAIAQIREGAIGKFAMAEAVYPWSGGGRGAPPRSAEDRLRNWYYVLPLSGDFIVEQSIHSLDIATWILNADPLSATGVGGRKLRPADSIYDHFVVTYRFPDDLALSFTCIQSIPLVKDEIRARVYGSEGFLEIDYFAGVHLRGKETAFKQNVDDLYTSGTLVNISEFHDAVVSGDFSNPTVAPSVRSNLTAILGREAVYGGTELTLAALLRENKSLQPDLSGCKD